MISSLHLIYPCLLLILGCLLNPIFSIEEEDDTKLGKFFSAENKLTEDYLNSYKITGRNVSIREEISKFMKNLSDATTFYSVPPGKYGSRYFFNSLKGLYMRESNSNNLTRILEKDSYQRKVSEDGELVSFSVLDRTALFSRRSWRLRIKNITSGEVFQDILNTSFKTPITWLKNGEGFLYMVPSEKACETQATYVTSYNDGVNTTKLEQTVITRYELKLQYHRVGENQTSDDFIADLPCADFYESMKISLTSDEKYIFMNYPGNHWPGINITLKRHAKQQVAKLIRNGKALLPAQFHHFPQEELSFKYVGNDPNSNGGIVYMLKCNSTTSSTGIGFPKLVKLDLENIPKFDTVKYENITITIGDDFKLLQARIVAKNKLFLNFVSTSSLEDHDDVILQSRIQLRDLSSSLVLFEHSELAAKFVPRFNNDEITLKKVRVGLPNTLHKLDLKREKDFKLEELTSDGIPLTFPLTLYDNYEPRVDHYTAKDGKKIPMYITSKKGLKIGENSPVLIHLDRDLANYYQFPSFLPMFDGIVVRPIIRSISSRRHLSVEDLELAVSDLTSCAEYLIEQNYTTFSKILLYGGSGSSALHNIITSATFSQKPELFGAVKITGGALDLVETMKYDYCESDVLYTGKEPDANCFNSTLQEGFRKYSPLEKVQSMKGKLPNLFISANYGWYNKHLQEAVFNYKNALGKEGEKILIKKRGARQIAIRTQQWYQTVDTFTFAGKALGLNFTLMDNFTN